MVRIKAIKLNFRNKLFFIYALFVVVILAVIANIYFYQNRKYLTGREEQALIYNADQIGGRVDDNIARMEHAIEFLLSDISSLDSIIMLGNATEGKAIPKVYLDEASSEIRKTLHSYFLEKHFYRVVFFNQNGYVIANNNRDTTAVDPQASIDDIGWISDASGIGGRSKLIGIHQDEWGLRENPQVYSLIKEIQGASLGFVEVQCLAEDLRDVIIKPEDQTNFMLFTTDGNLLFAVEDYKALEHYRNIALSASEKVANYQNDQTGKNEMIALYRSEKSDTILLAIEDYKDIQQRQWMEMSFIILTWIIIAIASIAFVWFFAWKLTKPIKQIEGLIEQTEISNIGQKLTLDRSIASDEIVSLYRSYRGLMKRLSESIEKEKQSSLLQMKAQFDTLQAQINPHFIYNILNVISQRGMMADDELTCEICGSLADILRYSTNTKQKTASIAEEITYLDKYCFLLKTRYRHRFEYSCEIDDCIREARLPKLTLQQLIENSIAHGFTNSAEIMKIRICGWTDEDMIYICMHDNGQGFDSDKLSILNDKFSQFRDLFKSGGEIPDLEIGGMGLVNTYARLYLFYREELVFELSNDDGAKILIGFKSSAFEYSSSEGRV